MKKSFLNAALVVALMGVISSAWATKPTTPPANGGGTEASADAAALGVGLAVVKTGDTKVDTKAEAKSGDTRVDTKTGDTKVDASSGNTYVLPAPAVTYVPASNGTVLTKSHAVNLLVFSWSKSDQEVAPDHVASQMIADMERLCQFETASMLRQRRYALVDPSYRELPAQPGVKNYTQDECVRLRAAK